MPITVNFRSHSQVLAATGVVLLLALSNPVAAAVTGQCANCHTMHNSQNGAALVRSGDGVNWGSGGVLTGGVVSDTAWEKLLISSCVGCHTFSTVVSIVNVSGSSIPIVFNTTGYPSQPLAGGKSGGCFTCHSYKN